MEMGNELQTKYIVYITINLVNGKIYIGIHKTENPYKFDSYLGCGIKTYDRASYFKPKYPLQYAVKKYGPKKFLRKTLKVCDTLEQAKFWEKVLVDQEFINRADTYNAALGGGVPPKVSKIIYQYSMTGEFIAEWASIVEASIALNCSQGSIGAAVLNQTPSHGYLWSDIKYEFADPKSFKMNTRCLKTYLYDQEGNFIQEFTSALECAGFLSVNPEQVTTAARGHYKLHNYYPSFNKYEKFPVPQKINYKKSKLYQYGLDGKFIKQWNNYNEIKKAFGKNLGIHAAIRLGNTCAGYQWSWEKVGCMKNLITHPLSSHKRAVGKYTVDGELVKTFNSVTAAIKDTCGAGNALRGKRKTAGGFVWKYLE